MHPNVNESIIQARRSDPRCRHKEIHVTRRLIAFSDKLTAGASGCQSGQCVGELMRTSKGDHSLSRTASRPCHRHIMASEENPTGLLGAVSSAAQQATSVVSSALEAMHITAPHDQDAAAQDGEKDQNDGKGEGETESSKAQASRSEDKDTEDLEEGEIRETNGKQDKQGPRTVFEDPASFNLKVCCSQRRTHSGSRLRFDALT